MSYLALMMMAPWLLILGWAYWYFPRALARSRARRGFDAAALLLAAVFSVFLTLHVFQARAGTSHPADHGGSLGMQALFAYGVFVAVLALAWSVRQLLWRRRASDR